jgi:hypothetical protein
LISSLIQALLGLDSQEASLSSTSALMMGMDNTIIDRIAFGGVKELEELYQQ